MLISETQTKGWDDLPPSQPVPWILYLLYKVFCVFDLVKIWPVRRFIPRSFSYMLLNLNQKQADLLLQHWNTSVSKFGIKSMNTYRAIEVLQICLQTSGNKNQGIKLKISFVVKDPHRGKVSTLRFEGSLPTKSNSNLFSQLSDFCHVLGLTEQNDCVSSYPGKHLETILISPHL